MNTPLPEMPEAHMGLANAPLAAGSFQRSVSQSGDEQFPIPQTLNLVIIGLLCLAAGGIFWCTAHATQWWEILGLAIAFGVIGNSIYSIVHEAEHRMLHRNHRLNDVLGAGMALLFPAPYHLIRQGHLGHHQRNRSDDEAFDLYFAGENPIIRWLQLYGILTGAYWLMVVLSNVVVAVAPGLLVRRKFEFNRPSAALMESLNPAYWRLIRLEGLLAIALHSAIIVGLDIPPARYLAVYFGFGFSWSAMQYVHHFETERHVLLGAQNLRGLAALDWMWLHHNWHRTHHRHPTIPWIHLPRLGRAEDPQRPFLLWRYLRMWRGPRYSEEHVENRFAGRIIQ